MEGLSVLQVTGNSFVKSITSYRNKTISSCLSLKYLDDRPVFPVDRAAAEAWLKGGYEAEKILRKEWAEKEQKKLRDCVNDVIRLGERIRKKREEEAMNKTVGVSDDSSEHGVNNGKNPSSYSQCTASSREDASTSDNNSKEYSNNDLGMLVIDDGDSKVYALSEESKKRAMTLYSKKKDESRDIESKEAESRNSESRDSVTKDTEPKDAEYKDTEFRDDESREVYDQEFEEKDSMKTTIEFKDENSELSENEERDVDKSTESYQIENKEDKDIDNIYNEIDDKNRCKKSKFITKVVTTNKSLTQNNSEDFTKKDLSDSDSHISSESQIKPNGNECKKFDIDCDTISENDKEEHSLKFDEDFFNSCRKFIEENEKDSVLDSQGVVNINKDDSEDSDIEDIIKEVDKILESDKDEDNHSTCTMFGSNWMLESKTKLDVLYKNESNKIENLDSDNCFSETEYTQNFFRDLENFAEGSRSSDFFSNPESCERTPLVKHYDSNIPAKSYSKPVSMFAPNVFKKEAPLTDIVEMEKLLKDAPPPRTRVNKTSRALQRSHEAFIKGVNSRQSDS
ncbi:UNVERIFIED_CONTAM: hypothetical protein RMT77_009872 [Armadillidium vulgare]